MAVGVRHAGNDGSASFRIPGLVTTNKGTLLGVYDVRYNSSVDLQEYVDVGLSRSTDGGKSWEKMRLPLSFGEYGGLPKAQNGVGDPSILVDTQTNTVWVVAAWTHGMGNQRAWWSSHSGMDINHTAQLVLAKSTDDGKTWSKQINITEQVKDPVFLLFYDKKETYISLGYKGCEAVYNGRTSVEDGLYFIMNQKGQYLASPIHVNGGEATWVTVKADEQLTAHMPAYQWVVLKKNTADKVKAYSPVTITNREFATELSATVQLMLNEGAKYMYTSAATDIDIKATDSLIFVQVKDAEGVKGNAALIAEAYQDSLLGYKNIPDAKFLLDEYTFKYLHPYATGENSKYLATVSYTHLTLPTKLEV